jgi:hypothetical protein
MVKPERTCHSRPQHGPCGLGILTHHKNSTEKNMDKVTRYEWHGSGVILVLLCLLGITIPMAVVYFMTNLLRIETQLADSEKLSDFLRSRK